MSNQFPTSLNSWSSGNTIESAWANAIEAKIGINGSAVASSIDYKLTSSLSSNPGHKHTIANGATDFTGSLTSLNSVTGLTYASASFVKMTGANTFALDTSTYYKSGDSPTFAGMTLTAFSGYVKATAGVLSAGSIADGDLPSALTGKSYNALTLTAAATGFTIAGGTTSKTLTLSGDATINQSVDTTATPSFTKLTVTDQPGARAYKSASTQTINDATFTKIVLDAETFDNDNEFATNTYTVTSAGTYLIIGQVFYTTTVNAAVYRSCIYVNGSAVQETQVQAAGTNNTTCLSMHVAQLAATNTVELYTYHNAGSPQTVYNHTNSTSLTVIKIY